MNSKPLLALIGGALLLGGCQTVGFADNITDVPPSAAHKRLLIEAAKENLYDPYSVRDAELSPQFRFPSGEIAYCGRLNAKNAMGGYTGRQYVLVVFNNERITNYITNHAGCQSSQDRIRWHRFVELENL